MKSLYSIKKVKKLDESGKKKKEWRMFEEEVFLFFKEGLKFPYVDWGKYLGRAQIDIAAGIGDNLLIIDCKTKKEPGLKNLHNYITHLSGKQGTIKRAAAEKFGNKFKNISFILVLRDIDYTQEDIEYAKDSNIALWGDKYFDLLKYLYTILGPESRHYFLKELSLGQDFIKDGKGKFYEVPALRLIRNGVVLYSFFIEADKLLKLSYVSRIESGREDAYQRLVARSRLGQISDFIRDGGTFKNNIIVGFEKDPPKPKIVKQYKGSNSKEKIDSVMLKIEKIYLSLWIIDGQHRLYGYSRLQEQQRQNYVPVLAIQDLDHSEQARTFVDINQNQKPVDSSILWDLFDQLKPEEEEGAISRVVKTLAQSSWSMFRAKIYIPNISKRNRKQYSIYFSNFCKGLLDRGLIDSDDKVSLYNFMPDGYGDQKGVERVAKEINHFYKLVSDIAIKAGKLRWVSDFILTNNGLNVFLRVFMHCRSHFEKNIDFKELENIIRVPLKKYFILNANNIDSLRKGTSSEGTREDVAFRIVKEINNHKSNFASRYISSKSKELFKSDVYRAYASLEKALRRFIESKLSKITKNWWKERLPDDVRLRADNNFLKGQDANPFISVKPRKKIDCLDFMDYPKILTRSDNWRDVFSKYFRDDEYLRGWFRQMLPIRNKIGHPADLSQDELEEFLRFSQKIITSLK